MGDFIRVEKEEQTPFYNRVASGFDQEGEVRGYMLNPGGAWMAFLSKYRKSQPKPRTLKEGAALVKRAGAAYRARIKRNPELTFGEEFQGRIGLGIPELKEVSNQNILVAGVVAFGVLWAWNRWTASR